MCELSILLIAFGVFAHAGFTQEAITHPKISRTPPRNWHLSDRFSLSWDNEHLEITRRNEIGSTRIWSTVANQPFVSASAGNDNFTDTSGAFLIEQEDTDQCRDQNVTAIESVKWDATTTGQAVQVRGYLLDCGEQTAPYAVTFWIPEDLDDRVAFYIDIRSDPIWTQPLKKLYFRFASDAEEDFYGLGAQASFASLKGQSIPVFSREQGVGRGDEPLTSGANADGSFTGGDRYTTYTAVPSYVSTDGRVFYLSEKSTGYANFSFSRPDEVVVRYDSLSVDGAFTVADNMFDAIEALTEYTGRMPSLPAWVDNGAILGIQGGQLKVESIVEQGLRSEINCPIAGVWLQDWCGTHPQAAPYVNISRLWWNWENDDVLYPTWNEFVQNLRDEHNVRTLTYVNAFLANVSTKTTGYRRSLYNEASAASYFVQNTTTNDTAVISSGVGIEAGIIDLTNPALRSWFADVLRAQVWNANISGFMSDFGEYTPVTSDTKLYSMVSDAFFYHNAYPFQWAALQRGVVEALDLDSEALVFHRSAAMSSNRHMNLFWVGDQTVDWGVNDGIKSVVAAMLHMGISGYSQQHSDIGGYTTILTNYNFNITRTPELLGRWGELAAVSSPVFRSHEGNVPQVNAQFYSNSSTYSYYAYNARMFVSLSRYRRRVLATESETKGWPLLRPPVLYHTQDARARNISYQSFYLGQHLYVAPVLDPDTIDVEVYFPGEVARSYEHVWTGSVYHGGQTVHVLAPFGKPAVFIVDDAREQIPELEPFLEFVKRENETVLSVL